MHEMQIVLERLDAAPEKPYARGYDDARRSDRDQRCPSGKTPSAPNRYPAHASRASARHSPAHRPHRIIIAVRIRIGKDLPVHQNNVSPYRLYTRRSHPRIEDYWLTGKIRCGLCGGTLQGVSGTSHTGATHYYYSCKNHRKHACKLKNQRKELMETIVLYLLGSLLRDPALRILIADACYAYHMAQNDDNGAYEASIRSELKEVEGKLANIIKAIEKGIFGDTMAEQMNMLESRKSMLNDALLAERNRKKFALKHSDILRFLDGFVGDINSPNTRRSLLDGLIDNVYVYPDKLAAACFYSDDRRELPFEETAKLIENSKAVRSLAYLRDVPEMVSEMVLRNMSENEEGGDESLDKTEENPDFFP